MTKMNEPLAVREAPASYQVMLDAQRVRPGYKCPKGYKQTEMGVIPEDWEVKAGKDTCVKIQDGTHFSPTIRGNDYFYVTSKNVRFGFLDFSNADRIDAVQHEAIYKRCDVRRGDILLTKDGANTGNAALNDLDEEFSLLSSVAFLRFDPQRYDASYFLQQILSTPGQQQIKEAMSGNAITRLTLAKINKLRFPVAPVQEQRAIAAALSDVDALLAKLDQLIAKKRDLKQAAMQQLITGSTRLPGFSGEWEVKPLEDICWFQEGPGVRNHQFTKRGVKLLNGTNIANGKVVLDTTDRYISEKEAFGCYKHFLVDDGDILIASSGVTIDKFHEKVAFASTENLPLCMNTSTIRFKTNSSELHDMYLYFFLQSDLFKEPIGKQATGSAQLNFGPAHLKKIYLNLPPTLEEQTAIAAILSDMDAELAALEARRAKTRDLKQGMMQELLTGRIRLV